MNETAENQASDPAEQMIVDEAARAVAAVHTALQLGLAPVVDQASPALHALLDVAGEAPPPLKDFSAGDYVVSLVTEHVRALRAKALWPHPKGTRAIVQHNGVSFETTTLTAARATPSGAVLVGVEGVVGSVEVQSLRAL